MAWCYSNFFDLDTSIDICTCPLSILISYLSTDVFFFETSRSQSTQISQLKLGELTCPSGLLHIAVCLTSARGPDGTAGRTSRCFSVLLFGCSPFQRFTWNTALSFKHLSIWIQRFLMLLVPTKKQQKYTKIWVLSCGAEPDTSQLQRDPGTLASTNLEFNQLPFSVKTCQNNLMNADSALGSVSGY